MKNGKILLLHRTQENHWELPGGTVEEGDGLEDTAIREGSEETGCSVKIGKYLGYIDFELNGKKYRSHQYSAELVEGKPHVAEPELFDGIEYVELDGDKKLAPNIVKVEELTK